jgi:hypothetical protein
MKVERRTRKMNVPGFIAETSLYKKSEHYQRAKPGSSSDAPVVPAYACSWFGQYDYSQGHCRYRDILNCRWLPFIYYGPWEGCVT